MELGWTFDDGFSAHVTQGLDEDVGGTLTRKELRPLARVNVESLHKFEFFTYLGLTDVDEVYGAQAGAGSMLFGYQVLDRTVLFRGARCKLEWSV